MNMLYKMARWLTGSGPGDRSEFIRVSPERRESPPTIRNGVAEPMQVSVDYLERVRRNHGDVSGYPRLWAEYPDGRVEYYPKNNGSVKIYTKGSHSYAYYKQREKEKREADPYVWHLAADLIEKANG